MTLDDELAAAKARVEKLTRAPSTADLLELYALYKQALQGDVQGSRPGMIDFKGRAKYDAWAAKRGTPQDTAKQAYVAKVAQLATKYG